MLELYPYVYATGDLCEWRALSHSGCVFCGSVTDNAEEQLAAGNLDEGATITVHSAVVAETTDRSLSFEHGDGT